MARLHSAMHFASTQVEHPPSEPTSQLFPTVCLHKAAHLQSSTTCWTTASVHPHRLPFLLATCTRLQCAGLPLSPPLVSPHENGASVRRSSLKFATLKPPQEELRPDPDNPSRSRSLLLLSRTITGGVTVQSESMREALNAEAEPFYPDALKRLFDAAPTSFQAVKPLFPYLTGKGGRVE